MKLLLGLLLISNFVMTEETFKNKNQENLERSFGDFLKWRFTRKQPEKIKIEKSDQWEDLTSESNNYAVWIGIVMGTIFVSLTIYFRSKSDYSSVE